MKCSVRQPFPSMFGKTNERAIMRKNQRQSLNSSARKSKHQQEMEILRAHHELVMKDEALREVTLVGAGIFVRTPDGKLSVAKPYAKVITSKSTI